MTRVATLLCAWIAFSHGHADATGFTFEFPDTTYWANPGSMSLDLDTADRPHVAFTDLNLAEVQYAYRDGAAWTVGSIEGTYAVNLPVHLEIDSADTPHICYVENYGGLTCAKRLNGVWAREVVYTIPSGEERSFSSDFALAAGQDGHARVALADTRNAPPYYVTLYYYRRSAAGWTEETVDERYLSLVGLGCAVALDGQDRPHLSYRSMVYDGQDRVLHYAWKSATSWVREDVFKPASGRTAISIDSQGQPHIAVLHATANQVIYARKSSGAWLIEAAGSGVALREIVSLALDVNDQPHITFEANGVLYYAHKQYGEWCVEVIDYPFDSLGGTNSIEIDSFGDPHVAYRYQLHELSRPVKYAFASERVGVALAPAAPSSAGARVSLCPNPIGDAGGFVHLELSRDDATVDLGMFDTSGRRVLTVFSGPSSQWSANVEWRAIDDRGNEIAPGTYFLRLTSSRGDQVTERVTIVR